VIGKSYRSKLGSPDTGFDKSGNSIYNSKSRFGSREEGSENPTAPAAVTGMRFLFLKELLIL